MTHTHTNRLNLSSVLPQVKKSARGHGNSQDELYIITGYVNEYFTLRQLFILPKNPAVFSARITEHASV